MFKFKNRLSLLTVACLSLCIAVTFSPMTAKAEKQLSFGVIPLENQDIMYEKFIPLVRFLSAETGVKVNLVVGKNYQDTMDALGKNKVQIAYMTPTTFPKSKRQNPGADIRPLFRFQSKGKGTYCSCIIVPFDSDIKTIEALKGQPFAFGNKNSTSSHLMPRSILAAKGIAFEDIKAEYLGSHTNVAAAVSSEQFSGGGVKESVANKFAGEEEVRILLKSDPIPEFPVCVNKHVSPELIGKITVAFNKLNDGSDASKKIMKSINKKYTGVEAAKNADYDVIRTMIQNLYGDAFYKK